MGFLPVILMDDNSCRWDGGVSVDGGEGPRRLDELYKLVVVADDPLRSMRAAREC